MKLGDICHFPGVGTDGEKRRTNVVRKETESLQSHKESTPAERVGRFGTECSGCPASGQ